MDVKKNWRIAAINHAADREIEFVSKSILKSYGRNAFMPTLLELMFKMANPSIGTSSNGTFFI